MAYRSTQTLSELSGQKIIDSRDIIARLEELQSEKSDLQSDIDDAAEPEEQEKARQALQEWEEENQEELTALEAINEEGSGYGDWSHGTELIREDYREDFVRDYAEESGCNIPSWITVDWAETASDFFRHDWTTVDIEGETYYYRA